MPEQTVADQLQEHALQIAGIDIELLVHPKGAPGFDFESQREFFNAIKEFYGEVASARFKFVADQMLNDAAQVASRQRNILTGIQGFNSKTGGDPNQNQVNMIQSLRSIWQDSFTRLAPLVAYARSSSGAFVAQLRVLNDAVNATQQKCDLTIKGYSDQTEALQKLLKDRADQLEQLITAARETAKNSAVATQAQEFQNEARASLVASRWWIWWTAVAVSVGLAVVWFMFLWHTPKTDPGMEPKALTTALIQQTVARVLIVALVYAAVVWCARNFFASRHNYTVNRHRRNAMQTFQAFVAGSGDKATQDFILKQAALCAFSPQQTGYLKDESLPVPAPTSQFIDVIKPNG